MSKEINRVQIIDARQTAKEWIEHIKEATDPERALYFLKILLNKPKLKPSEDKVGSSLNVFDLIKYAIQKYVELGGDIMGFIKGIDEFKEHTKDEVTWLAIRIHAVDLALAVTDREERYERALYIFGMQERHIEFFEGMGDVLPRAQKIMREYNEIKDDAEEVSEGTHDDFDDIFEK